VGLADEVSAAICAVVRHPHCPPALPVESDQADESGGEEHAAISVLRDVELRSRRATYHVESKLTRLQVSGIGRALEDEPSQRAAYRDVRGSGQ
jgi:hypothetical protein